MWTHQILNVTKTGTTTDVEVEFSDGQNIKIIPYHNVLTLDQLKNLIRNQLEAYQNIDAFDVQVGSAIDLSSNFQPTALQIAQQNFRQKRAELLEAKANLDLTLIDQATYDVVLQEAKNAKIALDNLIKN